LMMKCFRSVVGYLSGLGLEMGSNKYLLLAK
jgi:hypothetical protein